MTPSDIMDRLRHHPAVVAVVAAVVVLGLLVLVARPDASSATPAPSASSALAAQAAPVNTAPREVEVEALPAPTVPVEVPSEEPAAPVTPGPAPVSDPSLPVVNEKSRPMEGGYVPPAPVAAPIDIPQPVGVLYQRQQQGSTTTGDFSPVSSLPSDASVVALIHATFPASEWSRAERIAGCESGMRSVSSKPNTNGSRDHGIFQLNDGGTLQGLLRTLGQDSSNVGLALDPVWNVRAAHVLWTQRGWQPWACAARLGIVDGMWSSTPGPNW